MFHLTKTPKYRKFLSYSASCLALAVVAPLFSFAENSGMESIKAEASSLILNRQLTSDSDQRQYELVVFSRQVNDAGNFALFIGELAQTPEGFNLEEVTEISNPDGEWSDIGLSPHPDGNSILFRSDRNGNFDLYELSLADGSVKRWTNTPNNEHYAEFSHNGQKIVVDQRAGSVNGKTDVFVMDAVDADDDGNGDNTTRLTTNGWNYFGNWSPDGQKIAFRTDRNISNGVNSQVFIMDPDGENEEALTDLGFWDTASDWKPDSEKVVFQRDSRFRAYDNLEFPDLIEMDLNSGDLLNLTSTQNIAEYDPKYSADGSKLIFSSYKDGPGFLPFDIEILDTTNGVRSVLANDEKSEIYPFFLNSDKSLLEILGDLGLVEIVQIDLNIAGLSGNSVYLNNELIAKPKTTRKFRSGEMLELRATAGDNFWFGSWTIYSSDERFEFIDGLPIQVPVYSSLNSFTTINLNQEYSFESESLSILIQNDLSINVDFLSFSQAIGQAEWDWNFTDPRDFSTKWRVVHDSPNDQGYSVMGVSECSDPGCTNIITPYLSTVIEGPGILAFNWKILGSNLDHMPDNPFAEFSVNGFTRKTVYRDSSFADDYWGLQEEVLIPSGTARLIWNCAGFNDPNYSFNGLLINQVEFTPTTHNLPITFETFSSFHSQISENDTSAQVSTQLKDIYGITFQSVSGANFVLSDGERGIIPADFDGNPDMELQMKVNFFIPETDFLPAKTDFVSVKTTIGDNSNKTQRNFSINLYNLQGELIANETWVFNEEEEMEVELLIEAQGIHSAVIEGNFINPFHLINFGSLESLSIPEALGQPDWQWTFFEPDSPYWISESDVSLWSAVSNSPDTDGHSAIGEVSRNEAGEIDGLPAAKTNLNGPGVLSFSWKLNVDNGGVAQSFKEGTAAALGLDVNGQTLRTLADPNVWANESLLLPEGEVSIVWHTNVDGEGTKLDSLNSFQLDNIQFSEGLSMPIDFEFLEGGSFIGGTTVEPSTQLSDQLLDLYGVTFASGSGTPYVAIVDLEEDHAHSGFNGIGGVNSAGQLAYQEDIEVSFFVPGDSTTPAITDFVSIYTDIRSGGGGSIRLEGYDIDGRLIANASGTDGSDAFLRIDAEGIHRAVIIGGSNTAWDDLSFSSLKPAIVLPEIVSGPTQHPETGREYYLLSPSRWTEAQAKALALGGHLVTINDEVENQWVFDQFANFESQSRALWIGLNDMDSEGIFLWSSGDDLIYENWAAAAPDNLNGVENWVHMMPGHLEAPLWNDAYNLYESNQFETSETVVPFHGVVEVIPEYVLELTAVGNGSASSEPALDLYEVQTEVTLTATPDEFWRFNGWSGDVESTDNPLTITMDSDKAVSANFEEIPMYDFNISANEGGTISLDGELVEGNATSGAALEGRALQLVAAASQKYIFTGWSFQASPGSVVTTSGGDTVELTEAVVIEDPEIEITVMNPISVTAQFELNIYDYLAFSREINANGDYAIFLGEIVVGENGPALQNATRITNPNGEWSDLALSAGPEGKSLLFRSDRDGNMDVYELFLEDGTIQRWTNTPNNEHHAEYSPDGQKIVVDQRSGAVNGKTDVWIMDAVDADGDGNGDNPVRLTTDGWNYFGKWSPDGQSIAFRTDRNIGAGVNSQIFVMDADGENETEVTGLGFWDTAFDWRSNGEEIVFQRDSRFRAFDTGEYPDLWSVNIGTGEETNLTQTPNTAEYNPVFSTDEQYLVFSSYEGGPGLLPFDITLLDLASSQRFALTENPLDEILPVWVRNQTRVSSLFFNNQAPTISAEIINGEIVISWPAGEGFILQSVTRLDESWNAVEGVEGNTYRVTLEGNARFFRLIQE